MATSGSKDFELDVADEKSVISMVRQVKKTFGQINVLLNNAGIAAMNHILTTPYSNAQTVFSTNFFGTFLFSREVAKVMMKQRTGSIINYSTVAVPLDLEGEAVYAASKAAVESFTRISAKELGISIKFQGEGLNEVGIVESINGVNAPALNKGDIICRVDKRYFRPAEVETLLGSSKKAREKLGWIPEITVQEMCAEMVREDLKNAKRIVLLKAHED